MTQTSSDRAGAIVVEGAAYRYPDGTLALRGLSLSIEPGETVCVAGPNGAGKSTFLSALAGLLKPEGAISIDGTAPGSDLLVGLVFQDADDQLFCPTVFEDVAFGPRNQGLPEHEVGHRVAESLAAAGLTGFESRAAHHLSGGEKKRAAIAAVLACRPRILAIDEPWANLDARAARAVSEIIREFRGTRIVASHDLYRAGEVCDRLVIVDEGRIVAQGRMRELLEQTALLDRHGLEFGQRCRDCRERHGEA